jgi:hypothetical protein
VILICRCRVLCPRDKFTEELHYFQNLLPIGTKDYMEGGGG